MTNTFHEGDQGGQFLADQAAVSDVRRQRQLGPACGTADTSIREKCAVQWSTAVSRRPPAARCGQGQHCDARGRRSRDRTSSVLLEVSDLFGREGLAFVLGVAGLAADGTLGPVLKGGLGLDDVRGRGLGGRGGILAGSGKVFAQTREFRRDGVEFGLQQNSHLLCSRRQFGQGFLAAVSIAAVLWVLPTTGCVGKEKARAYAVNAYLTSFTAMALSLIIASIR